eukprot:Opistho-1_new@65053
MFSLPSRSKSGHWLHICEDPTSCEQCGNAPRRASRSPRPQRAHPPASPGVAEGTADAVASPLPIKTDDEEMRGPSIISGSSHPVLAKNISEYLNVAPTKVELGKFSNQETSVAVEESVRGEHVFIVQSGFGNCHVNDSLMELLILANACKTACAERVVAVIPYFPYSKQSKKKKARSAIPAKLVADMLKMAGVQQVLTMDLHASQMQGFFNMPVDSLYARPLIAKYIRENVPNYQEAVIVSKNAGGAKRVTSLADALGADFAIIHEEEPHMNNKKKDASGAASAGQQAHGHGHEHHAHTHEKDHKGEKEKSAKQAEMVLAGDVAGKTAIILDDMMDGSKAFCAAARLLKDRGATKIYAIVTHGILSGNALDLIASSPIDEVVVTNTIPNDSKAAACNKIKVIDVSPLLGEAIRRIFNGESVSFLFERKNI